MRARHVGLGPAFINKRQTRGVAAAMEGHLARAKALVAWKPDVLHRVYDVGDLVTGALLRDYADDLLAAIYAIQVMIRIF